MQEIDYYYRAYDRVLKEMFIGIAEHRDDGFLVRFEHFEDENPIYMRATGVVDDYYMMVYEGDIVRIREEGENYVWPISPGCRPYGEIPYNGTMR